MLRAHLLWNYRSPSNFISWSSSILWALEHAARMHRHEEKSNVHIAVMDVKKIHDMAIFPATTLMRVYRVPASGDDKAHKLQRAFYTSEYLFYGALLNSKYDPCFKAVRWDHFCKADLCNTMATFSARPTNDDRLYLRIEELRASLPNGNGMVRSQDMLPPIVAIASLFGTEFQVVVTIALITTLYGHRTPLATDFIRYVTNLRLNRPRDVEDIVGFDFRSQIDPNLVEVVRMYETLTGTLRLSRGSGDTMTTEAEGEQTASVASMAVQVGGMTLST